MNKTTAERLTICFTKAREIVESSQRKIDNHLTKFAEKDVAQTKLYNATTLAELRKQSRSETSGAIRKIKNDNIRRLETEFTEISSALTDWVTEPIPDKAIKVLSAYKDFSLKLSADELRLLEESVAGNYIGSKILSGIAEQNGLYDVSFRELTDLKKDIATAKNWAISAIRNYNGLVIEDENRCTGDMFEIDMDIRNRNSIWFSATFSDTEADNPFTRAERELCNITESEFDILPRKRSELDAYFADADDAERLRRAVDLIKSESELKALLPVYDEQLNNNALTEIENEWKDRIHSAEAGYREALSTLSGTLKAKPA